MLAARLHQIGDFRVDEIDDLHPKNKELLVKVLSCGICGSDIPRIFSIGTSNNKYPLTIGHEFGGKIVEVGPDADKNLIGKKGAIFPLIPCNKCQQCKDAYYTMCDNYGYLGSRNNGGFAQYCLVPSSWNFIEASSIQDDRMFALVEPCTVAQHAVRAADLHSGSNIVIFGAGPIGIMAARWSQIFSANKVMLVDVVDEKVEFAKKCGVHCISSKTQDILKSWKLFSGQKYADAVIEGTGFGSALGSAIELCKPHGKLVLMGNPAFDTQIKQMQHSQILRKELCIKGIWNSYYKAKEIDEWEFTLVQLASGKMEVLDLITHQSNLQNLPNLCKNIHDKKISICKAIFYNK